MDRRRALGLLVALLGVASACSSGSELRDAVEADRDRDGRRSNGSDDGWHAGIDEPTTQLVPGSSESALVLVEGLAFGDQVITSVEPLGACGASCLASATEFAESSAANWELTMLYRSFCDNCESSFMALVGVDDDGARSIDRESAIDLLLPIDTVDEVRIVFDEYDLIRQVDDGWEVIRVDRPSCTDEDTPHGRWSVSEDGEIAELESYVTAGNPDNVACV